MLTFAPSCTQSTVTHVLYKLVDKEGKKELVHCKTYDMNNAILTRIIKYAFWNVFSTSVAVIYDEESSQLVSSFRNSVSILQFSKLYPFVEEDRHMVFI